MQMKDISQIKLKSSYLRQDTDIESLKKSIETIGLIHPLVINENNELISGARRFSAMKELGHTKVPVHMINCSELEQELMSIDENLIRLNLNKVEFEKCLSRGKEIYEKLNPEAKKFEQEDLSQKEENEIQKELPNHKRSFIDLTAQKTGLSKKVIKSAIERDIKSSDKVKKLRSMGELNASQTNEIIKLNKEDQEKIIDHSIGKSAKELKEMVKLVQTKGLAEGIHEIENTKSTPKEYMSLINLIKRANKLAAKILLEEMKIFDEKEKDNFKQQAMSLQNQLMNLVQTNSKEEAKLNHGQAARDYAKFEDEDPSAFENGQSI